MKRYYVLTANYDFVEYANSNTAISSLNWIVIMITNFEAPDRKIDDFSFINKAEKNESFEIKINDWSASLENYSGNNYGYFANFRFVAPDGRLRSIKSFQSRTFSNIVETIKKFVTLSQFNNWEQYDSYLENIELKKKIEVFEEKIQEDGKEIHLLKNRIEELEK